MLLKFFRRKIAVRKTLSIFYNIERVFIPPNGAIIRNENAANCTVSKFAEQFSFETRESQIETALVHKSGRGPKPGIGNKRSGNWIALGHAEVSHLVESRTTDQCLCGLRFDQAGRELVSKDGFQPKHGRFS